MNIDLEEPVDIVSRPSIDTKKRELELAEKNMKPLGKVVVEIPLMPVQQFTFHSFLLLL